jgi:hypothetical protein
MEYWLSRSLFHELFLFSRWNSGYQEAFFTNSSFFHDGILAIKKSFSRTFFFFHDGILSIRKPFLTNSFSFFTMEFWLSGSLSHGPFSFFTMEFWLSGSLSHEPFSFFTMEFSKYAIWGKTLFIYITKSIYTVSASLKTLPLDLEPPLQGKEYGPLYSNATKKRKANVFSEITYRHVIRIF